MLALLLSFDTLCGAAQLKSVDHGVTILGAMLREKVRKGYVLQVSAYKMLLSPAHHAVGM